MKTFWFVSIDSSSNLFLRASINSSILLSWYPREGLLPLRAIPSYEPNSIISELLSTSLSTDIVKHSCQNFVILFHRLGVIETFEFSMFVPCFIIYQDFSCGLNPKIWIYNCSFWRLKFNESRSEGFKTIYKIKQRILVKLKKNAQKRKWLTIQFFCPVDP